MNFSTSKNAFSLHKTKPGEVSPEPCYCFVIFDKTNNDWFMYLHESLLGLALMVILEYKEDKHLVGY